MANHAKVMGSDGNGFKGGIRLSWPAVSALIAVMAILVTVHIAAYASSDSRLSRMETKLDSIAKAVYEHVGQNPTVRFQ